jgi:hypothetical protein
VSKQGSRSASYCCINIRCFVAIKVFYLQREIRTIQGISQKFIK